MSAVLPVPKPVAFQELTFAEKVQTINRLYLGAMLVVFIVLAVVVWQMVRLTNTVTHTHPLIVRVDQVGRAEAVNVNAQSFAVNERELKYFARLFTELYFTRDRATIAKTYPTVGYYMRPKLFAAQQSEDAKSKWMEKFLSSGDDNQEIDVTNTTIQPQSANEYQALVYFDKVFMSPNGTEAKREKYIETLRFAVDQTKVTSKLIPYNPLGFFVEHIKTDKAFE